MEVKKILLKDIAKIQRLEMQIFAEEDGFPVDYRVVKNKERAIYNILNKITKDWKEWEKIRSCIYKTMWNQEDITYKPICNALRELGYEIIEG